MIDDHATKGRRTRIFIPVIGMNGWQVDLLVTGAAAAAGTDAISDKATVARKESAGSDNLLGPTQATDRNVRPRAIADGTQRIVPVADLSITGLELVAANDGIQFGAAIPADLDVSRPIGVRALWTSEAAAVGARTITFQALYKTFASLDPLAIAATALDTTITAQAPKGTTKTFQYGNRGVIKASTVATTALYWTWRFRMSAFDASFVEAKYLLGVEIDYMRLLFDGRKSAKDAPVRGLEVGSRS